MQNIIKNRIKGYMNSTETQNFLPLWYNNLNPFVKAPINGVLHYGLVKAAMKYGVKAVTVTINIESYILLHVIKTIFEESVKALKSCSKKVFFYFNTEDSFLYGFTCVLASNCNALVEKIDQVYCFTLGIVFGKIRTAKETAGLPDRDLCINEIARNIFAQHVNDYLIDVGGWEIGRRGAQILLNSTIVTLTPCTPLMYSFLFFVNYVGKLQARLDVIQKEQTAEIEKTFRDIKTQIKDQIIKISNVLENNHLDKQTLQDEISILTPMCEKFEKLLDTFEEKWQNHLSAETENLNQYLEYYKDIFNRHAKCITSTDFDKFRDDLKESKLKLNY